jgi:hypothetical protein
LHTKLVNPVVPKSLTRSGLRCPTALTASLRRLGLDELKVGSRRPEKFDSTLAVLGVNFVL